MDPSFVVNERIMNNPVPMCENFLLVVARVVVDAYHPWVIDHS